MILIHGGIQVDPARRAEVDAAAVALQEESLREGGCVEFQLSWRVGDEANLRLLHIWETVEEFEAHATAPHVKSWEAFIKGAAAGPPSFSRYTI